jgi:hypothetical protein
MQPTFRVAPACRCNAPAKSFPDEREALEFAREAADRFRVAYGVYRVLSGRPQHLRTFWPRPVRA